MNNKIKRFRPSLIALDLDGTLTNDEKIITPRTVDALMKAQQQGIRLCLASGRPPYGMYPLAEQLRMAEYGGLLLCYNGGHVEDCQTGEVYVEKTLPEDVFAQLCEYQRMSGFALMTYYGEHIYTEFPDDRYVAQSSRNNKMTVVKVNNFLTDAPRPLNKCLLVGSPADVPYWENRIASDMEGRMHVCHSTPYFIELLPLGIDKGPALLSLLDKLGLTAADLMTFGDSRNDLSMIQCAGFGVAMGNAEDDIKAAADYVTLSNNDDGIAAVVEKVGGSINGVASCGANYEL